MRSFIRREAALVAILVLAGIARFWGIGFGLPDVDARPDETTVMGTALSFFTGDPNPHFLNYPTLYMYCLFGIYACCYAWGLARGEFASAADLVARYADDPTTFCLLDRTLSALAGTATVYLAYGIGARLGGRRTGLVAAFFLALAHLHVRDSHFGVIDVAATFLITCSALLILRTVENGSARSWLIAGALAGLAAATKYAGALLLAPAALALVLYRRRGERAVPGLLFLSGLVAAFLIGCPFALLDFQRFAHDFMAEAEHLRLGHKLILGRGWWYHLRYTLPIGLGRTLLWAGLAGIPILAKRDPRKALVFLAFPLAYYALAGSGQTVFARYMLPLIPFVCVTAALFVTALGAWGHRRIRVPEVLAICAVSVLVILPSVRKVVLTDRLLATKDSRQLAAEWARREIPRGSSVCLAGPVWRWRPLPEALAGLLSGRHTLQPGDQLVTYELWTYDQTSTCFKVNGAPRSGLPDYIFLRESPLLAAIGGTPRGLSDITAASYLPTASFHALDPKASHWFDLQDAVFLPLAGFAGVERPGPNIHVYRRKEIRTRPWQEGRSPGPCRCPPTSCAPGSTPR